MLKIRFQRTGRRNDPAFRIIVGEHTKHPTKGAHAAILGSYHPKTKVVTLDDNAVREWIAKGAQPSPTVHNLLISRGVIQGAKINVLPKKTPPQPAETPEAEKSEAVASNTSDSESLPNEAEVLADTETQTEPEGDASLDTAENADEPKEATTQTDANSDDTKA
jgi:small subunit ribosomal protein S16